MHILFVHSSANAHFGCFYHLAIVNNAAMNINYKYIQKRFHHSTVKRQQSKKCAKNVNRQFSKEGIQAANKHVKRWSA